MVASCWVTFWKAWANHFTWLWWRWKGNDNDGWLFQPCHCIHDMRMWSVPKMVAPKLTLSCPFRIHHSFCRWLPPAVNMAHHWQYPLRLVSAHHGKAILAALQKNFGKRLSFGGRVRIVHKGSCTSSLAVLWLQKQAESVCDISFRTCERISIQKNKTNKTYSISLARSLVIPHLTLCWPHPTSVPWPWTLPLSHLVRPSEKRPARLRWKKSSPPGQ